MITTPRCDSLRKLVNVDVLDLESASGDRTRHEQMIELLVLVVEDICVPFDIRDVRDLVYFVKDVVERREDGTRHDELIAIASNNDVRVLVLGEDCVDKVL